MTAPSPPPAGGFQTPAFHPVSYPSSSTSPLSTSDEIWTPVLHSPCHFPLSVFLSTLKSLSLHPERNSSFILRADPLPLSKVPGSNDGAGSSSVESGRPLELDLVEQVRVRLMPRQPKRDGKLNQSVLFYRSSEDDHPHSYSKIDSKGKEKEVEEREVDPERKQREEGLVIMIPEVKDKQEIPYYHPTVRKIAFLWETLDETNGGDSTTAAPSQEPEGENDDESSGSKPEVRGRISIHYLPFPESPTSSTNPPPDLSNLTLNSTPNGLAPRALKPRRRSPLAGPSIEKDESSEPTRPPAVILSDTTETEEIQGSSENNAQEAAKRKQAEQNRLDRTCLALLERLYKHGYGQLVGYQKRRVHDVIVPRDNFQDLYLVLKDRHRHLDSRAPRPNATSVKLEDVKRHVWKGSPSSLLSSSHFTYTSSPDDTHLPTDIDLSEWGEQDVAIAAFLMLLWKDMYPARSGEQMKGGGLEEEREWDSWGRPEGGFVDLGCGNGLLVHILVSEGYHGKGYELRSRRTWPLYPLKTQESLIELPIDLPSWFPETIEEWDSGIWENKEHCAVKEDTFLIGNHADELTPWLPLLSLIPSTPVPYLNLPCCLHTLDSTFDTLQYAAPAHPHTPTPDQGGFESGLEPGVSRYKSYLVWLGWCGLKSGWLWEKEGLRIPSTKGWGILARKRWTTKEEDRECRLWALNEVQGVRRRGAFKVREKEGKEH
ncbi:hypothetical protein CI109_104809 [Kwoniella shandongensis]|uniref:tRNA (uracil-O(2)-)-methyltransferase n=1 Tax=Kwoniella shandongensis TaxID=1734106 RepID=A0A5M6BT64_9TREE|nr:uncharacterized protein CI109_006893 [Kwoniella shandongensis]KAA5524805.1 hypothetical protein CI109_006893 [Kwoniella shandongensis]